MAKQAMERGYRTVMTARDPTRLQSHAQADNVLVLQLDVTKPDEVAAAVKAAEDRFGRIDVLANNAGIGYFAAIEEGEDAEVRKMFEVNVFGLLSMTQAVLPGMRQRSVRPPSADGRPSRTGMRRRSCAAQKSSYPRSQIAAESWTTQALRYTSPP